MFLFFNTDHIFVPYKNVTVYLLGVALPHIPLHLYFKICVRVYVRAFAGVSPADETPVKIPSR